MEILKVLRAGEELANPETWKHAQALTVPLGTLLYCLVAMLPPEYRLPKDLQETITTAIVAVVGAVNAYITYASSRRVGL